jgi:hypothetical protein
MAISTKMGVVWPFIIDQRLVHLTPHMFPCHRSHSWISGGEHFWTKIRRVPSLLLKMVVHGYFRQKCGLCGHLSSTRGSFKNLYVLAIGIIENGHSWLFSTKMGVVWPLIIDQRLVNLTPHMFPCHISHSFISGGDHFLVKNP